ncbi:MAG: hypothetical protein ACO3SP_00600 [Ilumatobacteraceae bacterium]
MRIGVGGRRSPRRGGWLPYESIRRLQRDGVMGFVMIAVSCVVLLIFGAANDTFTVEFVDGLPRTSDGTPCAIFEAVSVADSTAPVRAMVDCGDMPGLGFSGVIQHLFLALSAVGVLLLLSAVFSFVLASRMPGDSLAVPICVAGIVIGVLAVWWGVGGDGPGLAFQGLREQAVVGYLRSGGAVTTRDGAVSWGAGLLAASFVRITRP